MNTIDTLITRVEEYRATNKSDTSIKSKYPHIAEIWERLLVNSAIDEHTRGIIRCAYIRLILSEQKG